MALYLIVHHRQAPDQPYVNAWLDDDRIEAIQTPTEIGRLCENSKSKNERVFVHRCGWSGGAPVICCSALVEQAAPIGPGMYLVTFADPTPLSSLPPCSPIKGQNYYIA